MSEDAGFRKAVGVMALLLGEYVFVPLALITYTLAIAAQGLALALIWWYSSAGHRLVAHGLNADTIRATNVRLPAAPVMFLLAVPFAYVSSRRSSWRGGCRR